jgi:hypothetical protein
MHEPSSGAGVPNEDAQVPPERCFGLEALGTCGHRPVNVRGRRDLEGPLDGAPSWLDPDGIEDPALLGQILGRRARGALGHDHQRVPSTSMIQNSSV